MRISDWSSDVCSSDLCPILNCDPGIRYPVLGASLQRRGGVARHDAVAWGFARGADARGVDIIQNCEVTGFRISNGRIQGVDTSRGYIGAGKVGCVTAGHSSRSEEHTSELQSLMRI